MNTFGVNFIVRRNSTNRKIAHLFARIAVNEGVVESALKGRVDPDCWFSKKEEFRGKTEEVKAWNKYVENTRFRITQHFRKLEDKESVVSAEAVKWAFEGKETRLFANNFHQLILIIFIRFNGPNIRPQKLPIVLIPFLWDAVTFHYYFGFPCCCF